MSDIERLRDQISDTTLDMIRLLKTRTDIAKKIGQVKQSAGKGVTDQTREDALRNDVVSLCDGIGLDWGTAAKFLNFLLADSIKVQSASRPTHLSIFLQAKSLERKGRKIIHMEVGEPDFAPPSEAGAALADATHLGHVRYGQASGMPQLRCALAAKLGNMISEQNIMVSPGARFSVYAAITTLLHPGDEMIVIEPAWPAYKDCALYAGVKVRTVGTLLENNWEPDIDQIRDAIGANTRMIVLNYPNNPTGKVLPIPLLDEIMRIAAEHNLYVLSDEIYSKYASADWKSVLEYSYNRSIIVQSFSKSHAMTGFRIGYAISDSAIISKMSHLTALCLTSVSEPIQYAALKALEADTSDNTALIQNRLAILVEQAEKMKLEFTIPDGAMYLFARIGRNGADLADRALERGLAIAPGEGFGNYPDYIRISACQSKETLIEGMDILGSMMGDNV